MPSRPSVHEPGPMAKAVLVSWRFVMARVNENYLKLKAGYLFPEIGRRVSAFQQANPDAKVIKLGIGDVTRPLAPSTLQPLIRSLPATATEPSPTCSHR